MQKNFSQLCTVFLMLSASYSQAVTIGSNTAVSRQTGFITFSGVNNSILGFTFLDSGFALQSNTTTCTYNALFPVRGQVALNQGTLYLLTDLVFDNVLTFTSLGNIVAPACQSVFLPACLTDLGASSTTSSDLLNIKLIVNGNLTLHSPLVFSGNCTIEGISGILSLAPTASIIVDVGSSLRLQSMRIEGVAQDNITCLGDNSTLILQDIDLVQSDNTVFHTGSILFEGTVSLLGSTTCQYTSNQTSTIASNSTLYVEGGYIEIGNAVTTGNPPLYFTDSSALLQLDNTSLIITASGINLTQGTVEIDRNVEVTMLSTASQNGMILGNGNPSDDVTFYFSPASQFTLNSGYIVYNNGSPSQLQSSSTTAYFVIDSRGAFYVTKNLITPAISVEISSVNSTLIAPGISVTYAGTNIVLPAAVFTISGERLSGAPAIVLSSNDQVIASHGSIPLNFVVTDGSNNLIAGSGNLMGSLTLSGTDAAVTVDLNGLFDGAVNLGDGGTISLIRDQSLGSAISLQGSGTMNIGNNSLMFGTVDLLDTSTIFWLGSNGAITLNSDITLSGIWTFSGNVTIVGNGHDLIINETGQIFLADGAQLTLQNVFIDDVSGSNISCLTDNAFIVLQNSTFNLNNDFTFTQGAFNFKGLVTISGEYNFIYQSDQSSEILKNTTLVFDQGLTFSYDPVGIPTGLPIIFADDSSALTLNGSTLYVVPTTGMDFTGGQINLISNTTILTDGSDFTSASGGLAFGTGVDGGDTVLTVGGGVILSLLQGKIVYQNTSTSSVIFGNSISSLYIGGGTSLALVDTIDVTPGQVEFGDGSTLASSDTANLFGTVLIDGAWNRVSLT